MESSWSKWNLETKKKKLTPTLQETLELFFNKNSISQIAKKRGFEEESIERQIIDLITQSYINIDDILEENIKKEISDIIEKNKDLKLSEIKEAANEKITFFQIKCFIAHLNSFAEKMEVKIPKKKYFGKKQK
ncbi:MAG: helix-turn-helix domain-containing protein [Candidatus Woesearchaeota archaeon]|jgi:hypothetical protein|nr:helix-turn-helix domain-containing protein [Candidatus Woesearchaeota archaeon]